MSGQIVLRSGDVVLVDEADMPLLGNHHWLLHRNGERLYAWANIRVDGERKRLLMHRHLMSAGPDDIVDHINGNGLDNRRSVNLRLATNAQNRANSVKRAGVSQYKGVYNFKGKWRAQIVSKALPSKPWYIGTFDTERDAALAYDAVARLTFKDCARLNFPREGERSGMFPGGRHKIQQKRKR